MASSVTGTGTTQNAWNQLDQLLTCAICLDRYRNPKLLPCQHTFCMEPCLEGLIDYIRRQIKCPECRAEHRIPYQGIQGFPTNVTLMRFLELHIEVTGDQSDPLPAIRERCGVCSEKAYLAHCAHCDKKVCPDCKEAHLDILKREITRINNQVRRGLHRLQDALGQIEKTVLQIGQNCSNVTQEIEEVYQRLQKEIKDREETLKNEVESFLQTELRNLNQLKDNLELEVSNIQSNSELVDKHVNENTEWEDVELVDYKDTFLKTLEFLRNFDPDQADFNRRLKFHSVPDPETMHQGIINFGELVLNAPNQLVTSSGVGSTNTIGSNLMRSKSDHRLATQFHRQEESRNFLGVNQRLGGHSSDTESRTDGRATSPLSSRRRPGEIESGGYRRITDRARDLDEGDRFGSRRYTREFGGNWQREEDGGGGYRSRFSRGSDSDMYRESSDPDIHSMRSVRFARQEQQEPPQRERVLESEDAIRGPLSGIARLADCPRVVRRLQINEQRQKQKLEEKNQPPQPAPTPAPTPVQTSILRRPQRQMSDDDEIAKIKAQNKAQDKAQTSTTTSTTTTTTTTTTSPVTDSPTRPLARRVAALQKEEESSRSRSQDDDKTSGTEDTSSSPTSPSRRRNVTRQDSNAKRDSDTSRDSTPSRPSSRQVSQEGESPSTPTRKGSLEQTSGGEDDGSKVNRRRFYGRNQSDTRFDRPSAFKGNASTTSTIAEVTKSGSESDSECPQGEESTPVAEENKDNPNYFRFKNANYSRTPSNSSLNLNDSQDESKSGSAAQSPSSPQSPLFGRSRGTTTATKTAEDKSKERAKSTDSSSSSSSSSSESSSSPSPSRAPAQPATVGGGERKDERSEDSRNRFGSFRNRDSPMGRTSSTESRKEDIRTDGRSSPNRGRAPYVTASGRTLSAEKSDDSKEEVTKPKFVSRFLPRPSPAAEDSSAADSDSDEERKEKERDQAIQVLLARSALARRESSGSILSTRDSPSSVPGRSSMYAREKENDTSSSAYGRRPSTYAYGDKKDTDGSESRYSSLANKYLTRSRTAMDDDKDDSRLGSSSSYSRYLSRSKSSAALVPDHDDSPDDASRRGTGSDRFRKESRFSALRRNRLGRSRSSHDINAHGDDDDEEDDKDMGTSSYRSSRFDSNPASSDFACSRINESPSREQSPEDTSTSAISSWAQYLRNKYGTKGSKTEGKEETKTDVVNGRTTNSCSTNNNNKDSSDSSDDEGITVTRESILGARLAECKDRPYSGFSLNLRSGENPRTSYLQKRRVIMKLGTRGSEAGNFTWPRGVAVGTDNCIVVADSSNHRVQVFDSFGNFTKEFGTYGSAEGEFDCLAGVAVNRIGQFIISDRYNHRIQVFDPSGRFLRAFGSQGMSDGRLSYPWGITTDSLGFIYVCDKENHRVQVFQSDGTFVGKFGSLGNKQGQLEHPHYIAVSNTNKVVVTDSNNHRVQIFDVNGRLISSFGSEGTEEGQFKFPRGVAVDDQGYIIVGDSGNNRIQIFNSDGSFLKSFGSWGSGDGEFKGLEGVAVTSYGHILVCDRENHRVQIF